MADHVSGKSILTPIASVYAEMDESGEVNLFHGIPLARSLYNGLDSRLFMVGSSVSDEVEIWPGASLYLNRVLLGDLNSSSSSTF
jgi:hypothetical protein